MKNNKGNALLIALLVFTAVFIFLSAITRVESEHQKNVESKISLLLKISLEKAYVDGQRDAIQGNIRIKQVGGHWEWIKSPWDKRLPDGILSGLGDAEPPALVYPLGTEEHENH